MSHRQKAQISAIHRIRNRQPLPDLNEFAALIRSGDRSALATAFTFLESTKAEHHCFALELLSTSQSHVLTSFRLGITGVPGVGKSTLIERLGMQFIAEGHRVAVLAVDPSSPLSGGSILGDKTRMQKLSMNESAFIRPTASSNALGGVANDTKLAIQLCEMAGFDRIIVETVGVGQSEVAVHDMTDMFLLLMLAGAGDQLQGIKRGIVELCDAIAITKSDGENRLAAERAKTEYLSALHLLSPKSNGWIPKVAKCSAVAEDGLAEFTLMFSNYYSFIQDRGLMQSKRHEQDLLWLKRELKELAFRSWLKNNENDITLEFEKHLSVNSVASVLLQWMKIH